MRSLVTGAAGFIGSRLCQRLLEDGEQVLGLDALTDYYDVTIKQRNLNSLLEHDDFEFILGDLTALPLSEVLTDVDVVYHLAGQPGVRLSWGQEFTTYVHHNVLATQVLLEASRERRLRKFVYASSSSVYGDAEALPTSETVLPRPVSPYGVTKLAGEHLCQTYEKAYNLPTVALRLFTVYGPGQRPDMAFSRMITCALTGTSFELYGDGEQTRDFTYVDDVVQAFRAAGSGAWTGVANIGGGSRVSMNEVAALVHDYAGDLTLHRQGDQRGDVRHTGADIRLAAQGLAYSPRFSIQDGLQRMVIAMRDAPHPTGSAKTAKRAPSNSRTDA